MATNWTNGASTSTQWSSGTINPTFFSGREVVNLGAIMDDTLYLMDDSICTMDDMKLNSLVAPATSWT